MNNLNIKGTTVAFLLMVSVSSFAAGPAYVMSIPYALSDENIYKVRVEKIDGERTGRCIRYLVTQGRHSVTVSLILDVEWTPNLSGPNKVTFSKIIDLSVEDGKSYQLGAKVNIHAPLDSQLDGSFWDPILYRSYKN